MKGGLNGVGQCTQAAAWRKIRRQPKPHEEAEAQKSF